MAFVTAVAQCDGADFETELRDSAMLFIN